MVWVLLGLVAGLAAGFLLPTAAPRSVAPYLAVAALACADFMLFHILSRGEGNISRERFVREWSTLPCAAFVMIALGAKIGTPLEIPVLTAMTARAFLRPLLSGPSRDKNES